MSPQLPTSITRALRSVGRRRRWLALLAAFSWTSGSLGIFLVWGFLSGRVPSGGLPLARWLSWFWLASSLVGPLVWVVVPVWRRTGSLLRVARATDLRLPEGGEVLATAVDLGTLGSDSRGDQLLRDQFIALHMARAEEAARDIHPTSLLPLSGVGRVGRWGAGLLLVGLCLTLVTWPVIPEGVTRLLGPSSEVAGNTEGEQDEAPPVTLVLKNLSLLLTPPAYSGRDALLLEGTTGDFRALAGTHAVLEADVVGPSTEIRMVWLAGVGEAQVAEVSGERLRIEFVTPGAGRYRVELLRADGDEPLRTRPFRVEALPDEPPVLEVRAPADGLELHPDSSVTLGIRASDDFELSKVDLVVERRGRTLRRRTLELPAQSARWEGEETWTPSDEIGEQGGDVQLVVEAFDNDDVSGPKVTRSRPVKLYVPTPRDHHARVLELKDRLLELGLDFLADVLVGSADAPSRTRRAQVLEDFDLQNARAGAFFSAASELVDAMEKDELERQDVYLGLGLLIENVARTWSPLKETVESRVRSERATHLQRSVMALLSQRREQAIVELERVVLDLSAFVDLQIGEKIAQELAGLEPTMSELASLIRRSEQGEPVSNEIQSALSELAQAMRDLAESMAERSSGPNEGFVNEMPQELGEDMLQEIERLLSEGRHEEAMERLREAMEAVSEMKGQLEKEASEMAGSQVSSALQEQLGAAMEEVEALEQEQKKVVEETEALQRQLGAESGLSEDERAQIRKDIEALRDHIEALPPAEATGMFRAEIRNWSRVADRLAFNLAESFAAGELEEAASLAANTADYLGEILRVGQGAPARTPGRDAANTASGQGQQLAVSLSERLTRASKAAERARTQASQGAQGTRKKQSEVRKQLGKLGETLEGLGGSAYNPVQGRQQLKTAGQLMQRAESRLAAGELPAALGSEADALKQLGALRESLENSQQAMQNSKRMGSRPGGSGSGDSGRQASWRQLQDWNGGADPDANRVELTDPDDFVSPEAFRSLIQEEASGDAPKRYRPLNNSYYEELVR